MLSNLPPGVTDDMIPGNRPEDQEVETWMIFSVGEIEALRIYNDTQQKIGVAQRHELWDIISNMIEQFNEDKV